MKLKEKISDTSLFAELVKDRHKRALALEKILDKKEEELKTTASMQQQQSGDNAVDLTDGDTTSSGNRENGITSENVMDIPIPMNDNTNEYGGNTNDASNQGMSNSGVQPMDIDSNSSVIGSPSHNDSSNGCKPTHPNTGNLISIQPSSSTMSTSPVMTISTAMSSGSTAAANTAAAVLAANSGGKITTISKLPLPPGIKPTDLEVIESPPSRTPTPPPQPKPKTPPPLPQPKKSGIMNLPMPPGNFQFLSFISSSN